MAPDQDTAFPRLVSLACHDLRTPLATVSGFAKTLTRLEETDERVARYLGMSEAASAQLAELLDELSLISRIEDGRYEPALRDVDTVELARAAAERVSDGEVGVSGEGATVGVDADATERSLAALARCALRHGPLDAVEVSVAGVDLRVSPITDAAAAVLFGDALRDFGAIVARRHIGALGGAVAIEEGVLRVRLPRANSG